MKVAVEELFYSYPGKDVLKGVTLGLVETEIICIVGPNGSGKSTLVKCVEGLQHPRSGRVLFDGVDAAKLSRVEIARLIGYVPQSSSQLFSASVFDTVMMGRKPHYSWRCSDEDVDIVSDILQMMELDDLAMDDYNNLSGGQQQRVLIARALAQEPQLLLLDEPTSALDISHQLEVMEIVHELVHSRKIGVMMVIHDLNLASRYADRIVMLHNGLVYAAGTAEDTLTEANIEEVYGVEADIHCHNGTLSVIPVRRVSGMRNPVLQAAGV
ncbi:MAG: ABC transporter ATP-binding protein [Spirochaetales bacterium]|nr:ABC transporter ATP-binding protein [Spirochaetales bacterium]